MVTLPPANFPDSPEELLIVISAAERYQRLVWTAGRFLKEVALLNRFQQLPYRERKAILKRITASLNELADQGKLERRRLRQSIGFGNEIGFNYIQRQNLADL